MKNALAEVQLDRCAAEIHPAAARKENGRAVLQVRGLARVHYEPELIVLRRSARRYRIGIALSIAWLVGATLLFDRQRAVEVGRLVRECHQLQADARSSTLCAETDAARNHPICRYKEMDCDRWPTEEARFVRKMAWFAIAPLILAWVMFYGLARFFRWRRDP